LARTAVVERKSSFSYMSKNRYDASTLFWDLWPGDIDEQLKKLNKIAEERIALRRNNGMLNSRWKPVSKDEIKTFISLFSVAACLGHRGINQLFLKKYPTISFSFLQLPDAIVLCHENVFWR